MAAILVSAFKISPLVNILQREEHYFTLLQVLLAYNTAMYHRQSLKQQNSFYKEKVEPELYSVLKNCVHALFLKVAWGRKPDIEFCVSLLLLLNTKEVFKYLNTAISRTQDNCRRLESVVKIGLMYNKINGLFENAPKLQMLLIKCKWSKRFKSFKISHKDLLNLDFTSFRHNLITSKHATLDLVKEFCYDFNVDLQECLMSYLEFLITSWDPHIVVSKDAKGKEEGTVTNSEETLLKKCNDIVDILKMDDIDSLKILLSKLWTSINFYYYEMYSYINQLRQQLDKCFDFKIKTMLSFLKTYHRVR
uniref:KNTC1 third ARM-repeats domain-containing protein n=2 Tax=Timema TaxID=61471 RepID=A0A7R9B1M3_TIMSH|nr:unnamed protein product [Timema shepardi]